MSTPGHPPPSIPFVPKQPRQFYLPQGTINRLGGPVAAQIMHLLVEGYDEAQVREHLKLSEGEFTTFTKTHTFKRELKSQLKLREHDEKFKTYGRIQDIAPTQLAQRKGAEPPAATIDVQLPKGVSPQEWALKRINQVTPQAVERLIHLMHHARQENVQYNAATKILGLNGIVEVEKSISVIADAEAIIRELNRRGPYQKKTAAEREAAEEAEIVIDASVETPTGELSSGVDSPPSPETN